MKTARSKQLEALARGRAVSHAKNFKKNIPAPVTEKEFLNSKVLLSFMSLENVLLRTGRSKNTILKIRESATFQEYRKPNQKSVTVSGPIFLEKKDHDVLQQAVKDLQDLTNGVDNVQDLNREWYFSNRAEISQLRIKVGDCMSIAIYSFAMALASMIFTIGLIFMRK